MFRILPLLCQIADIGFEKNNNKIKTRKTKKIGEKIELRKQKDKENKKANGIIIYKERGKRGREDEESDKEK